MIDHDKASDFKGVKLIRKIRYSGIHCSKHLPLQRVGTNFYRKMRWWWWWWWLLRESVKGYEMNRLRPHACIAKSNACLAICRKTWVTIFCPPIWPLLELQRSFWGINQFDSHLYHQARNNHFEALGLSWDSFERLTHHLRLHFYITCASTSLTPPCITYASRTNHLRLKS